ncbi:unnamed protein product [Ostreobium quekettii]|uniref:Uncharacterized protein n=1 Tax=Ostreobium quekettii TaxID=121088 RepID=A0A8S1IWM1_9CHLO|nr:unnamed protein product [Ostreobium quekettii]
MDASSFQRASRDLLKTHKEALRAQRGQVELMRFTDWFSKFSNSPGMSSRERLLLPGTPAIDGGEGTVAVVGFGQTVDVFMSKQRPKKLLVYGDDFGAHVFLVKVGSKP